MRTEFSNRIASAKYFVPPVTNANFCSGGTPDVADDSICSTIISSICGRNNLTINGRPSNTLSSSPSRIYRVGHSNAPRAFEIWKLPFRSRSDRWKRDFHADLCRVAQADRVRPLQFPAQRLCRAAVVRLSPTAFWRPQLRRAAFSSCRCQRRFHIRPRGLQPQRIFPASNF